MKKKIVNTLSGAAGLVGLAWLGTTAYLAYNQNKFLFNPTREPEVADPHSNGHRTRPVTLTTTDGTRLSGWLLKPQLPGPTPAVIYFGGRSEEVSWVVRDAGRMFPGMAVLVVNYRGYGASAGMPGEKQMIEDAEMLWDWLAQRGHVDPNRIAVVGRSLGTGVAVQMAVRRLIAALVLITPYDSILAIAKRRFRFLPVNFTLKHRFESVLHANKVKCPVYVLRAEEDDVVPHAHTDQLVAKIVTVEADEIIPESDHCNIPYLEETQDRIARYLNAKFDELKAEA